MKTVTNKQLAAISKAIVSVANPVKVILLGSQARGTADENSDVDLLVIGERPSNTPWSRRRLIGKIRRSLPFIGLPIDILFFTPKEIAKWSGTTNHIIVDALKEGEVIYDRS